MASGWVAFSKGNRELTMPIQYTDFVGGQLRISVGMPPKMCWDLFRGKVGWTLYGSDGQKVAASTVEYPDLDMTNVLDLTLNLTIYEVSDLRTLT